MLSLFTLREDFSTTAHGIIVGAAVTRTTVSLSLFLRAQQLPTAHDTLHFFFFPICEETIYTTLEIREKNEAYSLKF